MPHGGRRGRAAALGTYPLQVSSSRVDNARSSTAMSRRIAMVASHIVAVPTSSGQQSEAALADDDARSPLNLGADGFAEMDPDLSVNAGHSPEELLKRRLRCLADHGFVIIDDFETHPLLPRLEQASRSIHALCDAKVPLSLDTSRTYVHRVSEKRGESRGEQWTGTQHTFRGEEAWAIRGVLHPDWREYVSDQPVFAEFLTSPETLDFVERWSGLTPQSPLAMSDATLFVNPREADFSEGWHRDTRWHGGSDSNQQDKAATPPDWSPEAEKKRWAELQAQFHGQLDRGLNAGGVSMFLALVEDDGCHELVPGSHRDWRKDAQYERLRRLDGKSGHAPMPDAVPIRLKAGQGLVRNGVTIHRGRTKADKERLTMSWGWSKGSSGEWMHTGAQLMSSPERTRRCAANLKLPHISRASDKDDSL